MRTLVRPGQRGVLVRVEERGRTSFLLARMDDVAETYLDPVEALTSFQELERGTRPRRRGKRPLLGRLRHVGARRDPERQSVAER